MSTFATYWFDCTLNFPVSRESVDFKLIHWTGEKLEFIVCMHASKYLIIQYTGMQNGWLNELDIKTVGQCLAKSIDKALWRIGRTCGSRCKK